MRTMTIALKQTAFEIKSFRRNRPGAFFTIVFPIMFLLLFGYLNTDTTISTRSDLPFIQFLLPGIIGFGIISACYTRMGMTIAILRDNGVLKRLRGTPLSPWAYIAGQIGNSIIISAALTAVSILTATAAFNADLYQATIPGLMLTSILGAACFCALGLAITTVIPNGDSAPAIVQFSLWPVLFISNVFYPIDDAPAWLMTLADIFPVKHLTDGLQYAFDPYSASPGISNGGADLLIMALWTVFAIALCLWKFRWIPKVH